MSDFYQLSNSSSDFKSRSNDVFDRLINLEKQHDVQTQHQTPAVAVEDETPSIVANPNVPNNAIVFKKRSADETTFARPENKWKKYDLEDVNEHHLSDTANRRALNEFFRTRPKPEEEKEEKAEIVQRPRKKEVLPEQDEDEDQPRQIEIRATTKVSSRHDELDTPSSFKLTKPKKTRGVFSTNKKSTIKEQIDESDDDEQDGDEDEDEFFEP